MGFVFVAFRLVTEKILNFKVFLWIEKLENYFYFYFVCAIGTAHTTVL